MFGNAPLTFFEFSLTSFFDLGFSKIFRISLYFELTFHDWGHFSRFASERSFIFHFPPLPPPPPQINSSVIFEILPIFLQSRLKKRGYYDVRKTKIMPLGCICWIFSWVFEKISSFLPLSINIIDKIRKWNKSAI